MPDNRPTPVLIGYNARMKYLAGMSLIVCLYGCHHASIDAGGLDGKLVVLEGRWSLRKTGRSGRL